MGHRRLEPVAQRKGADVTEVDPAELASRIRLVALDVDGVLTDGTFLWDLNGTKYKRFCYADTIGIPLGQDAGLRFAIITGEDNSIVDRLAAKLLITDVYKGAREKARCMRDLMTRRRLRPAQVCYVGDDVNDIPPMKLVGFPVAVANANPSVFPFVRWVTSKRGGDGAVREVIDFILEARASARDVSVA